MKERRKSFYFLRLIIDCSLQAYISGREIAGFISRMLESLERMDTDFRLALTNRGSTKDIGVHLMELLQRATTLHGERRQSAWDRRRRVYFKVRDA